MLDRSRLKVKYFSHESHRRFWNIGWGCLVILRSAFFEGNFFFCSRKLDKKHKTLDQLVILKIFHPPQTSQHIIHRRGFILTALSCDATRSGKVALEALSRAHSSQYDRPTIDFQSGNGIMHLWLRLDFEHEHLASGEGCPSLPIRRQSRSHPTHTHRKSSCRPKIISFGKKNPNGF